MGNPQLHAQLVFWLIGNMSTSSIFYRLDEARRNSAFASALPLGTFADHGFCKECGRGWVVRRSPLIIRWQTPGRWDEGSDTVPDFNWLGLSGVMVTQRVRDYLEGKVTGIEFGPVEMLDDPKLHRPKRMTKRTKRRIWMPYEGPPVWDLIVPNACRVDLALSKQGDFRICPSCGRKDFSQISWDKMMSPMFVHRSDWQSVDFFRTEESNALVYVTEHAKEVLEAGQFTNLLVKRAGKFID
jgi:hypothetical protein